MSDSRVKPISILIVDNEKDICEMIAYFVKGLVACEIKLAESGTEAIKIISENPIDLVICDYNMPQGNGGEVYQHILEKADGCRFVLCSTKSTRDLKEFEDASSLFGELQKPNILDGLIRIVSRLKLEFNLEDKAKPSHVPITLSLLMKLNDMPSDIFLRISPNKYVKAFEKNQKFEESDFDKYNQKNIQFLFFLESDMDLIFARIGKRIQEIDLKSAIAPASRQLQVHHLLIDTFKVFGFKEVFIPLVEKQINETCDLLQGETKINDFIFKILDSKESYITVHSFILASITTIFASRLNWTTEGSFKKLVISSLMHDIFLDESSVNETQEMLKQDQSINFKEHPVKASEFLKQFSIIPPDTCRIVLEQHGAKSGEISRLGSLFLFCHFIADFIWEEHKFGNVDTKSIYKNLESVSKTSDHLKLLNSFKDLKIFSKD